MKKYILFLLMSFLYTTRGMAQMAFNDLFCDSTLRIDYIFEGNEEEQRIAVDKLNMMPRWYGKRQNLSEVPVEGNGQIIVRQHNSQNVVYRNSFSTLFQEWLSFENTTHERKAFENVFLVPMPKDTVDITVILFDNRRQVKTEFTHVVSPNDILIRQIGFRHVTPYATLQQAADTTRCIHIAYIAEGYTNEQMDDFLNDARIANDALFAHEPFKSLKNRFNIIAVKSPSIESGTSEPSNGIWRNTALDSHFDTFYSKRYLTTLHLKKLHDWMAGTPYEHIIVLVNTDHYGGGGILNSYNLSMTKHDLYRPVVVHEFGHSFAGLGDEYAYEYEDIPMYPHDIEPWEHNLTTLVNFHGKWENLISPKTKIPTPIGKDKNKVGVYEGAGYSMKGVYRALPDCRMRTNENPEFCIVCRKAITDLINFYTE